MAALQCEICGGKLMGKPGGIFECDSCGMEYSTEWAKAKIQEIKGTVKVEGTVEVAGTVKVDGPVKVEGGISVQSLCERGFFELENRNAQPAKDAFSRALDMDITWGDVYMGLIMCEFYFYNVLRTREEFRKHLLRHEFDDHRHFSKFLSDNGSALHQELVAEYRALLAREEGIIAQNRRLGMEKAGYYRSLRKKYSPIRGRITFDGKYILDKYGTLYSDSALRGSDFQAQAPWENMIWISRVKERYDYKALLMGMYANGTVIAENKDQCIGVFDPGDGVVEMLGAGSERAYGFIGLRRDGSLITATSGDQVEYVRDLLLRYKQISEDDAVEALCDLTDDFSFHLEVSEEGYDIAWEENGPYTNTGRSRAERVFKMVAKLRTDGTVFLERSCHPTLDAQVALWSDIIQVVPGKKSVTGLKADGTLVYAFRYETSATWYEIQQREEIQELVQSWTDIVFIRMIDDDVIAVRRDGTLVTSSRQYAATLGVKNEVQLFENIDTLAEELASTRDAAYSDWEQEQAFLAGAKEEEKEEEEEEDPNAEQREALQQQLQIIHRQLEGSKGIFAIKRRKELEERMGMILLELDKLKELN